MERNNRPTKIGVVVSAGKMNKTAVVMVVSNSKHPIYKKVVKKSNKFKVHDENNECGLVSMISTVSPRPHSLSSS